MISMEEAQAKFNEYCGTLGPHDEVYTDGSKIDERVGAAAVIKRHFQNGEITCRCLSKRLPDYSTIWIGLMKNAGKCWRLGGPWTEKSTEEEGLG